MSGSSSSDDHESIVSILNSLGIHEYDPLVVVALSEYAKRYASELLCDMKDYSVHANKSEIDVEDMKIAALLSNVKTAGCSPSVRTSLELLREFKDKPLPRISTDTMHHRIPGVWEDPDNKSRKLGQKPLDLLAPTFSFVPGTEAYPPINSIVSRMARDSGSVGQFPVPAPPGSKKSKFVHHNHSGTIPISLLNKGDRENYKLQERQVESMSKNQRSQQLGARTGPAPTGSTPV